MKATQQATRPAPTPYTGSRPSYGTPTSNGQMGGSSYYNPPTSQAPVQPQFGTPQPSTPANLGPSGFHSTMTSEQQQTMMDRQRARLEMVPQTRGVAPDGINRQGSGTPQPANGQFTGQQVNGTQMAV